MTRRQAQEKAVEILGKMGYVRVHKKGAPGTRYQVGFIDTEGVLETGKTFNKVSEGSSFEEALAIAGAIAGTRSFATAIQAEPQQ